MYFFKPNQPILQNKELSSDSDPSALVNSLRLKWLERYNLCGIYTCVDQAMLIWGLISGVIFFSAQFLPFSWIHQAIFWTIITTVAIVAMVYLTYTWTILEEVSGLIYSWIILMVLGLILTDYAIVSGWGFVLIHLCDLWLILSAVGYLITGIILRSRAFFLAAIIHILTIFVLPWFVSWQFAITGFVMMSNLLVFSEKQWDMLLPKEMKQYSSGKLIRFSSLYTQVKNHIITKIFKNLIMYVLI